MSEILSVGSMPVQDNAIIKKQFHSYSPYTSSYGANDEVRIVVQSQDLYVLPSDSYILIEVTVARKADDVYVGVGGQWSLNAPAYLFSEMRYEINNVEVDRIKNPGLTSNMKKFAAYRSKFERALEQTHRYTNQAVLTQMHQFIIPLHSVFGFCDDYRKIIMNAKHELILVVNRQDFHTYTATTDAFNINITKIQWKVPHVQLADHAKLQMLRYLERKQVIGVPYRSWDLFEMPQLPQATKHIWTVKSTTQVSKPRFVFVTFQTNKQIVSEITPSFDNCHIRDVKLYLNSEYYPYDTITCNFNNVAAHIAEQYEAFLAIQNSYYSGSDGDNPIKYDWTTFQSSPIFAFDCTRTDESVLTGAVDIRLEINARENIPANTVANCLIIYDNYFEYTPFSSIVVKRT